MNGNINVVIALLICNRKLMGLEPSAALIPRQCRAGVRLARNPNHDFSCWRTVLATAQGSRKL